MIMYFSKSLNQEEETISEDFTDNEGLGFVKKPNI